MRDRRCPAISKIDNRDYRERQGAVHRRNKLGRKTKLPCSRLSTGNEIYLHAQTVSIGKRLGLPVKGNDYLTVAGSEAHREVGGQQAGRTHRDWSCERGDGTDGAVHNEHKGVPW